MYKVYLTIILSIALTGCKTTENVKRKSVEIGVNASVTKSIGAANTISIPKIWELESYPMPKISGMQPVNYRVRSNDLTIAITGFPAKEAKKDVESIKSSVEVVGTPYIKLSNEGAANVIIIDNPYAQGGYASYSCKSDSECFAVFRDVRTEYVTTSIMHGKNDMVYNISIATNSLEVQEMAIASIKTIGQ